jgi:SAM-dependent methyltransferase
MSEAHSPNRSISSPNWLHRTQLDKLLQREVTNVLTSQHEPLVLDLGSGGGQYKRWFTSGNVRYLGADIDPAGGCDVLCVGEALPFKDNSIGMVFSVQVLEHVSSPEQVLAEVERVLVPGGFAVISTHGTFPYHPTPEDHWRWTQTGLLKVFDNAGFESPKLHPVGGTFSTLALLNGWYTSILIEKILTRLGPVGWLLRPARMLLSASINLIGLGMDRMFKSFSDIERQNTLFLSFVVVAKKKPSDQDTGTTK